MIADAELAAALRRALESETDPDVRAWVEALLSDAAERASERGAA